MMHLLRLLLSWSVRRVLLFVVIVAAMVAFVKVMEAYQRVPALNAEVEGLERQQALLDTEVRAQRERAEAGLRAIQDMQEPMLRERLGSVRADIAALEKNGRSGLGTAFDAARGDADAVAAAAAAGFRRELLRREEAVILARLATLERGAEVNGLAARITALRTRILALDRQIAEIERRHPVLRRMENVPIVREIEGPWRALRMARQERMAALAELEGLLSRYEARRGAYEQAGRAYLAGHEAVRSLASPTEEIGRRIAEKKDELAQHWASRAWQAVRPVLRAAAGVMLLVILVPPALKAFWFFVLAPLAGRLRPVRVGRPGSSVRWATERIAGGEARSAVSRRVILHPGEELLVRPDYLQSSVANARADSQMLLSPSLPLGSLASGLFGLTRIRADAETSAAVSATMDMIDEVGVLEVPEGAALVFRPRALVGTVQRSGRPLRLERVWTLGCGTSWLTLQLRHLVFHGPCALIVKGARGIALEPAAGGRRVAGAATMGWSAGLDHSVTRSETFLAYLTGKQSLFHDRFDGAEGSVVYEEMPRARTKAGIFGRGLEGLGDGLLKVVGL